MTVDNTLPTTSTTTAADSDVKATREQILKLNSEMVVPSRSLLQSAIRYILRDPLTIGGLIVLIVMTLMCAFAPPIIERTLGVDAYKTNVPRRYKAPGNGNNILGTDELGRDQLLRLLYGGRVSLSVAFGASILSLTIGVILGLVAGFYGGWIDDVINWFLTTLSSIPTIFLLILVAVIFTPSPESLVLLLGALGWIQTCRLVRAEVLSLKEREFIVAARSIGAPTFNMLVTHFLPNLVSLIVVTLTIGAGTWILVESGLSYLGLGIRAPVPSWGNMLTSARSYFTTGPHLVIWPGILIVITVLCFYVVGDGLRDAFDPRTRKR
ncbi:MAG: ABC transporter permease [Anaerolineae bacterium]|nr:ABC transporter permease [Anaerolineae bacterium]